MVRKIAAIFCATIVFGIIAAVPADAAVPGDTNWRSGAVIDDPGCRANQITGYNLYDINHVDLPFGIRLNRKLWNQVWINPWGDLSFEESNFGGPLGDQDELVWASEMIQSFSANNSSLEFNDDGISPTPVTYGFIDYEGHNALCVNWLNMGVPVHGEPYFEATVPETGWGDWYVGYSYDYSRVNSSQAIIVDRSDVLEGAVDIILNYDTIQSQAYEGYFHSDSRYEADPSYHFIVVQPQAGYTGGVGLEPCNYYSCWNGYVDGFANYGQYPLPVAPGYFFDQGPDYKGFLDTSPTGLAITSTNSDVQGRHVFEARLPIPLAGPYRHVGEDGKVYFYDEDGSLLKIVEPSVDPTQPGPWVDYLDGEHFIWVGHWEGERQYVAIGDSYQSGEGVGDYLPGTNEQHTNECHRSKWAYPMLLTQIIPPSTPVVLDFWACSGAEFEDLYENVVSGNDQPWNDPEKASVFVRADDPKLMSSLDRLGDETWVVTIGIGGNDVGFADVLGDCVAYWPLNNGRVCNTEADDKKLTTLIEGQALRYDILFDAITRRAPNAQVIVLGYPRFFVSKEEGDPATRKYQEYLERQKECLQQNTYLYCIGLEPLPDEYYLIDPCSGINRQEQEWINQKTTELNDVIRRKAMSHGALYIDIYDVGQGREVCRSRDSADWFMNGLMYRNPVSSGIRQPLDSQSFHPNKLGHQLISAAIVEQLARPRYGQENFILPNELKEYLIDVTQAAFLRFSIMWGGSDVEVTAISPTGVEYTESSTDAKLTRASGERFEYFEISDPEPGAWMVKVYGADILAGGESIALSVDIEPPSNEPPVGVIDVVQHGATILVSARNSTDIDGEITQYEWSFDGEAMAYGVEAVHTYEEPGNYSITLSVTDNDGTTSYATLDTSITVPKYEFGGFKSLWGKRSAPRHARAGNSIFLSFSLGKDWGNDIMVDGSPTVQQVRCATGEPIGEISGAKSWWNTGPVYNNWARRYMYFWKTERSWTGTCRKLTFDFNDGSSASHIVSFYRHWWSRHSWSRE